MLWLAINSIKKIIMEQLNQTANIQNSEKRIHHGQNIKRIRLLFDLSQKELACQLGGTWTAKRVSRLECSEKVQLGCRRQLAKVFEVDIDLFNEFDQAAARMAIAHIMRTRKKMKQAGLMDEQILLEEINDLLDSAAFSIHRESQNMQLLLRLLQGARQKTEAWKDRNSSDSEWEVNEPRMINWRVA